MDVLVIQPGFPAEIPYFVRGLKRMGARVLGIGDQAPNELPAVAKQGLDHYLQVPTLWDPPAIVDAIRTWKVPAKLDRVECLWEVAMELAAELRTAFKLPGLDPQQTVLFRDKDLMRQALDRAGVRNPRHRRASSAEEIVAASGHTGFPLIVKPVAGAGSSDTYRVDSSDQLTAMMPTLTKIPQVVVEEFVRGTELTFDTICVDGVIQFFNVELYRPDMLTARSVESVSPQTVALRDLDKPEYHRAHDLARQVIGALGYRTGFTHMEWFLTPDGEVVFGEIAGRPPGGNSGEMMNYVCDMDVYNAWAEAVLCGTISQRIERRYNVAMIFKRAHGSGRIQRVEGLERIQAEIGQHIVNLNLLPIGAPRRDWKQTLLSDGSVLLRHPDLATTLRMADLVATDLHLYAE